MAAPAPTVPSLKQAFVAAQITILAQPPRPSRAWHAANAASDHPIPPRALDDALLALAHAVQQHCRRVYPPQATRNVADQIADFYARDAEPKPDADGAVDGGAVSKELDLVDDLVIDALPPSWPLSREIRDCPLEAKEYVDAASRLARLGEERRILRQRVERLRHLEATIDLFSTTDGAGVQENLVTRDGPVEVELERMRFLLARVAGRVGDLPAAPDGRRADLDSSDGARKRAVDEFLADARVFPS